MSETNFAFTFRLLVLCIVKYTCKMKRAAMFFQFLGLSAYIFNPCSAKSSSDCQPRKVSCPCSGGGSVTIEEPWCLTETSCQPCGEGRRQTCVQKEIASKCGRLGLGKSVLIYRYYSWHQSDMLVAVELEYPPDMSENYCFAVEWRSRPYHTWRRQGS